jgi:hypothetical protein
MTEREALDDYLDTPTEAAKQQPHTARPSEFNWR